MKKLITLVMIMVVSLFVSANVSYGHGKTGPQGPQGEQGEQGEQGPQGEPGTVGYVEIGDVTATIGDIITEGGKGGKGGDGGKGGHGGEATVGDIDASNSQSQINEGNTTDVDIQTNITNPAPILPVPGFIQPNYKTPYDETWTSNPFDLGKVDFTIAELRRLANPSRFLFIGWCEWDKSFKIEMACWTKAKSQKSVQIYPAGIQVAGFTKMGEAHARAVELHKSEKQVAAALCVYAAKQGAKIVVIRTFSNPVTKADSAVLGGAGASVTGTGDIVNSAGGFGWTTAEKVFRSYVVAELYN